MQSQQQQREQQWKPRFLEDEDQIATLKDLITQTRATHLEPKVVFPAWSAVLVLAFKGFPNGLLELKKRIQQRFPGLRRENPGSMFPKITLAALKQEAESLSQEEFMKLLEFCTWFSASHFGYRGSTTTTTTTTNSTAAAAAAEEETTADSASNNNNNKRKPLLLLVNDLSVVRLTRADLRHPPCSSATFAMSMNHNNSAASTDADANDDSIVDAGHAADVQRNVIDECFADPVRYYERRIAGKANNDRTIEYYEGSDGRTTPEYTLVHFLDSAKATSTITTTTSVSAQQQQQQQQQEQELLFFDIIIALLRQEMQRRIPEVYAKYGWLHEDTLHVTIRALN